MITFSIFHLFMVRYLDDLPSNACIFLLLMPINQSTGLLLNIYFVAYHLHRDKTDIGITCQST